jgi:hypothetical protein
MSAIPQKQTSVSAIGMSAKCQTQTFCAAAETALFDHLVGAARERCSTFVPERVKTALNA